MIDNNIHISENYNSIDQSDLARQDNEEKKNYYQSLWSISKIEEELVFHLCSYCNATEADNDNNVINITHPYQEQAKNILYTINLANPIPVFLIYDNTLSLKLKEELGGVWKRDKELFNEIVTNSIKRLYESVDYHYFHSNGIGGKIAWAIVQ